jgi:hypothetical protein
MGRKKFILENKGQNSAKARASSAISSTLSPPFGGLNPRQLTPMFREPFLPQSLARHS